MLQGCSSCEICGRADAGDTEFLSFKTFASRNARLCNEGEDHLMDGGADPNEIRPLRPRRHHRTRGEVAEVDFAGQERLRRCGSAAKVDQRRIEAVLLEDSL